MPRNRNPSIYDPFILPFGHKGNGGICIQGHQYQESRWSKPTHVKAHRMFNHWAQHGTAAKCGEQFGTKQPQPYVAHQSRAMRLMSLAQSCVAQNASSLIAACRAACFPSLTSAHPPLAPLPGLPPPAPAPPGLPPPAPAPPGPPPPAPRWTPSPVPPLTPSAPPLLSPGNAMLATSLKVTPVRRSSLLLLVVSLPW